MLLFSQLKSELAPTEDRGTIVGLGIAPEGSTVDYTDRYVPRIGGDLQDMPGRRAVLHGRRLSGGDRRSLSCG